MNTQSSVGGKLQALRQRYNLSQENLAAFLDISRPMISYYETGERQIPLEHLEKLADFFGVDTYDFLDESTENQQTMVAFAFRAEELLPEDMKSIAAFRKVVKNYIKMKEVTVR